MLNNFERQTSVPKVYAFLGLIGLYFFFVFFNIGGEFLVNFAGFVIPGYYSLEALFSTSKVDDTQWLTVNLPQNVLQQKNCAYQISSTGLSMPSLPSSRA